MFDPIHVKLLEARNQANETACNLLVRINADQMNTVVRAHFDIGYHLLRQAAAQLELAAQLEEADRKSSI